MSKCLMKPESLAKGHTPPYIKSAASVTTKSTLWKRQANEIEICGLTPKDIDNLRTEIQIHRSLNHPNIVRFVDCLQVNSIVFILLENASNSSVFYYIHSQEGLPHKLALRFFYQTAQAIKYLHDQRIIHRDLKPENILLDSEFNVKLCDFGWACYLPERQMRHSTCGTVEYMCPEILNNAYYDERVDIWALGILLYEFLSGQIIRLSSLSRKFH